MQAGTPYQQGEAALRRDFSHGGSGTVHPFSGRTFLIGWQKAIKKMRTLRPLLLCGLSGDDGEVLIDLPGIRIDDGSGKSRLRKAAGDMQSCCGLARPGGADQADDM